ncbi:hypothetical protein FUAX_28560 [Fulvitalea axinellae]|uniref:DUF5808 domain-containing protein n=1 Tax=Fulvitalea axinellae TaxID=1182444 RepID=A0AAU9CE41_9BACT|nr:hypothetical protein FUAX_28560 [Fulvitalea axinellae]
MSSENRKKPQENASLKDYFKIGDLFGYFFRKKDPNRPGGIYLKMMHGINKFSILVFLLAVIYLVAKRFF